MFKVPAGTKSWVMPSVEDIFIFAGVEVGSGVDVGTTSVGAAGVVDGAIVYIVVGTVVGLVF
jgi:hypothetical protein